jgi:hypothetical protein
MPKSGAKKKRLKREWLLKAKDVIRHKVSKLRRYTPQPNPSVFVDGEVARYLRDFHTRFGLVPADKAANNIIVVCRRFYISQM